VGGRRSSARTHLCDRMVAVAGPPGGLDRLTPDAPGDLRHVLRDARKARVQDRPPSLARGFGAPEYGGRARVCQLPPLYRLPAVLCGMTGVVRTEPRADSVDG